MNYCACDTVPVSEPMPKRLATLLCFLEHLLLESEAPYKKYDYSGLLHCKKTQAMWRDHEGWSHMNHNGDRERERRHRETQKENHVWKSRSHLGNRSFNPDTPVDGICLSLTFFSCSSFLHSCFSLFYHLFSSFSLISLPVFYFQVLRVEVSKRAWGKGLRGKEKYTVFYFHFPFGGVWTRNMGHFSLSGDWSISPPSALPIFSAMMSKTGILNLEKQFLFSLVSLWFCRWEKTLPALQSQFTVWYFSIRMFKIITFENHLSDPFPNS